MAIERFPETSNTDLMHLFGPECWCKPTTYWIDGVEYLQHWGQVHRTTDGNPPAVFPSPDQAGDA